MDDTSVSKAADMIANARPDLIALPSDEQRERTLRRLYDPVLAEPLPSALTDILRRIEMRRKG